MSRGVCSLENRKRQLKDQNEEVLKLVCGLNSNSCHCITDGFPVSLSTFKKKKTFQRSSQLFNIVKRILSCLSWWSEPKAVDIDYSCLWIFLRAARMKGHFMVRRSGSNNYSRTSQNHYLIIEQTCARHSNAVLFYYWKGGEAMINIFQLVCESVFCLTMHLCIKRLDGSVFNKVERTQRSLDKSSCEVLGLHTFSSVGRLGSSNPYKTRGPVKPNQPPSVTHPATLGAISSMLLWSLQTEWGGLWEVWQ